MMAAISPKTVVRRATLMPPATRLGEMSPAASMASNASTMPTTVPRNPNIGASEMPSDSHPRPRSKKLISIEP